MRVRAYGSKPSATLRVFVTATEELIGTLTHEGEGKFEGEFAWPSNPRAITVRSNLGGSARAIVELK